jgi:hypothetical protein
LANEIICLFHCSIHSLAIDPKRRQIILDSLAWNDSWLVLVFEPQQVLPLPAAGPGAGGFPGGLAAGLAAAFSR